MDEIIFFIIGALLGLCIGIFANHNVQFSRQEAVKYKIGCYSTTTGAFELNKEFR